MVLGKTNDELCPVTALLQYLVRRGGRPGPLFQWQDRTPLSKAKFVEVVQQGLSAANLPSLQFAGHSFRIGAATTAAMVELQGSAIQMLGYWRIDCKGQSTALGFFFIFFVKKLNVTLIQIITTLITWFLCSLLC